MERLQTGQDRSSTSKVSRLHTVPAGQRYAMVMPSYFSSLSMFNAKRPPPHHHDMQEKTILAFRRIVLLLRFQRHTRPVGCWPPNRQHQMADAQMLAGFRGDVLCAQ